MKVSRLNCRQPQYHLTWIIHCFCKYPCHHPHPAASPSDEIAEEAAASVSRSRSTNSHIMCNNMIDHQLPEASFKQGSNIYIEKRLVKDDIYFAESSENVESPHGSFFQPLCHLIFPENYFNCPSGKTNTTTRHQHNAV